jgi:hypothetical protein
VSSNFVGDDHFSFVGLFVYCCAICAANVQETCHIASALSYFGGYSHVRETATNRSRAIKNVAKAQVLSAPLGELAADVRGFGRTTRTHWSYSSQESSDNSALDRSGKRKLEYSQQLENNKHKRHRYDSSNERQRGFQSKRSI